ncbi:MAG: transglycosylase SLT domain-containing protein, partial [Cyclobacteriaceae bacterium]
MKNTFFTICFLLMGALCYANIPQVPSQMEFAGMKLKITDAARAEMQKHVNSLRASDKYFKIKLDRVNLFFPIIERVFREENLPDDFKYLVIQESALIGDAVSSANAVGFWQFKDFTGREVGLRIDNQIDERMNIVAATRGAAKYMKTNNFYYNNWIYALMAYNTGRGGARKYVKEELYGVSKMTIDKKTHWYVKTFLAHKIAFENEIGGQHREGLVLQEYTKGAGENLSKIAARFEIEKELLSYYNKWLKRGAVPADKVYPVLLPVKGKIPERKLVAKKDGPQKNTAPEKSSVDISTEVGKKYATYLKEGLRYASVVYVKTNGIDGVLSKSGDDVKSMAEKSELTVGKFMKYNDLEIDDKIKPGIIYYTRKKKNKSAIRFHVLKPGESIWMVSQMYGVRLSKLRKYNHLKTGEPKEGRVLWLGKKMPKDMEPAYMTVKPELIPGDIDLNNDVTETRPNEKPPSDPV